jgi:uncharacterized protein YeeX (DUF496 family)
MFCDLIVKNTEKTGKIIEYIKKNGNDILVVTQNSDNRYLKNIGIEVNSLLELFPEISKKNRDVISSACKKIQEYRRILDGIQYRNIPVFELLEQFILEELLLVEKAVNILKLKKNIVFVFDNITFSCFTILKMAEMYGFEVKKDLEISIISDDKMDIVRINDEHGRLDKAQRIAAARRMLSKSKVEFGQIVIKQVLNKIKNTDEISLYKKIEKKMQKYNHKFDVAFFLATDIDDFLVPYYSVMEKCKNEALSYVVVSVDLTTREFLRDHTIDFVDLFDEVHALSHIIKRDRDFEKTYQDIERKCNENMAYVLCIKHLSELIKAKLAHTISIALIVKFLMEQYQIKTICIGIDGSTLANITTLLSRKNKIRTTSIEPGILNYGLERENTYKADRICIYGKQGYEVLKRLGYDDKRITVTGNPRYDNIFQSKPSKSDDWIHKKYGMRADSKKILIALSRWHRNDADWIADLAEKLAESEYEIIVKIHPIYLTQNVEFSQNMIKTIHAKTQSKKLHFIHDVSSSHLLSNSYAVITDYSNVGVEAMLRKIPLITVNFAKEDTTYMQKFHETGLATYAETVEDIITTIENAAKQNDVTTYDKVVEMYNYRTDGKATERIYKLISSEIN